MSGVHVGYYTHDIGVAVMPWSFTIALIFVCWSIWKRLRIIWSEEKKQLWKALHKSISQTEFDVYVIAAATIQF